MIDYDEEPAKLVALDGIVDRFVRNGGEKLVVWSFFVNVLDIPLVATMFIAEYLFRIHWLKNPPRHSLSAMLSMIADVRKAREEWASSP